MRRSKKILWLILVLSIIALAGIGVYYYRISIYPYSVINTLFFDNNSVEIPYSVEEFNFYSWMDYASVHGVIRIDSDRRKGLVKGIRATELDIQKAMDIYGDSLVREDSPAYWNPAEAESIYIAHPILIDSDATVRQMFFYFKDESHVAFFHAELW